MTKTVENMVCPQCAKRLGEEHYEYCPRGNDASPDYTLGWERGTRYMGLCAAEMTESRVRRVLKDAEHMNIIGPRGHELLLRYFEIEGVL